MIRPGTFRAKVTNYGVTVSDKTGEPSIWIEFTWTDGGETHRWNWTGAYTTEKSIARIHATLLTLGMTSNEIDELANGLESNLLDTKSEFEIVVKEEIWNDKPRTQIAFVNKIGGEKFGKTMSHAQAKTIFASKNAKAALAQARAELGVPKDKVTAKKNDADIAAIPF